MNKSENDKIIPNIDYYHRLFDSAIGDTDFYENYKLLYDTRNIDTLNLKPEYWDSQPAYRSSGISLAKDYILWQFDNKLKYTPYIRRLNELKEKLEVTEGDFKRLKEFTKQVSEATVLSVYAKVYDQRSSDYENQAKRWILGLMISFLFGGVGICIIVFVNISEFGWIKHNIADDIKLPFFTVAIKAGLVLVITQIIRFFYKNYNAIKHLQVVTQHKADVLNSLQAVYIAMGEGSDRGEFLKTAATIAFQPYESGYITRKEGAGESDNILNTILRLSNNK